jgi:3-oxoacyl-[acyl-carrier protein] reductase
MSSPASRAGGRAIAVDADLSSVQENRRLVEQTVDELGRLDIFVANAGVTRWSPFLEADEETWDTVVDLNLKGSYFGAQAAARQMVARRARDGARGGGRIVLSSSVTGSLAIANASAYAVTKAGLQHMARVLSSSSAASRSTLSRSAPRSTTELTDDPEYAALGGLIPAGRAASSGRRSPRSSSPTAEMVNGHN